MSSLEGRDPDSIILSRLRRRLPFDLAQACYLGLPTSLDRLYRLD